MLIDCVNNVSDDMASVHYFRRLMYNKQCHNMIMRRHDVRVGVPLTTDRRADIASTTMINRQMILSCRQTVAPFRGITCINALYVDAAW